MSSLTILVKYYRVCKILSHVEEIPRVQNENDDLEIKWRKADRCPSEIQGSYPLRVVAEDSFAVVEVRTLGSLLPSLRPGISTSGTREIRVPKIWVQMAGIRMTTKRGPNDLFFYAISAVMFASRISIPMVGGSDTGLRGPSSLRSRKPYLRR